MNTIRTLVTVILLMTTFIAQAKEALPNQCLDYNKIKNTEFYILKDAIPNNEFKKIEPPIILWKYSSSNYTTSFGQNIYFHENPSNFLKQFIKTAEVDLDDDKTYVLNTLTMTYTVDNENCILSFPFDTKDIAKIDGSQIEYDDFSKSPHTVHLNGHPYTVKGNIYAPFFIALSEVKYIRKLYHYN